MLLNLDHASFQTLRIFVAVSDSGSFSAAARQMRLWPSSVTNHVVNLERMLGVALFDRTTTQKVSITDAGQLFYKPAKLILEQVDVALEVVSPEVNLTGHLRVVMPPSFAVNVVARSLGQFIADNPDISLAMIVTSARLDMIADRTDVAFTLREEVESHFSSTVIAPNPRAFCATP